MRRLLPLFLCAVLFGQSPQARRHFANGVGLFGEHDDTGDALREADTEFTEALRLAPRYAAARAYQGLVALEFMRDPEAEAAFREALTWDPKCAEALVGLARLSQRRMQPAEALALLRQAVAGAPRNALARRELGYLLANEDSKPSPETMREAIECFRVLIALDRNDRDAHYALGRAYRYLGRWREAEPEFREVLRIGQTPEDSDVWVYSVHGELGEALAKQGKNAQAIREYEALIASQGVGDEEIRRAREAIETLRRSTSPRR
jgi:tetratricopeptide (TPR) repeat protein